MKRLKVIALGGVLLIVLSWLLLPSFFSHTTHAAASAKSAQSCGAWNVVSSPHPKGILPVLSGVAAITPNNVWAVGDYYKASQSTYVSLIEHWTGTKWQVIPSPSANYITNLNGITALNTNDIWAVGSTETRTSLPSTLIEHWNGTSWSVIPSPSIGVGANVLLSVAAVSATNVWAVGYYPQGPGSQTLTEQWNGTSWNIVASGDIGKNDQLNAVSAVQTTGKLWAVGYSTRNTGTALTEFYC